ncbi:MAG TPA: hypothetical protein VFE88_00750 [Candidatus Nanoarchaeia archaeon]|nr:hypothetical protein [Candidatus Nanoarchaeia archaeon]
MKLLPSFANFFKKKEPLTLNQIRTLAALEMARENHGLQILPGKEKIKGLPMYMIARFRGVTIAQVFKDRVIELPPLPEEEKLSPEEVIRVENLLQKIKKVCQ